MGITKEVIHSTVRCFWMFLNWEWQDKNCSLESYFDAIEMWDIRKATQKFNSYNPYIMDWYSMALKIIVQENWEDALKQSLQVLFNYKSV